MHTSSKFLRRAMLPVFGGLSAGALFAGSFSTGFEDSVYTAGSSIIGVVDPASPASNAWVSGFATSAAQMTISSAHPFSGSKHLRIDDNSTSVAFATNLNLGASFIDTTKEFTVSFAMAVGSGYSDGTTSQGQILFGTQNSTLGSAAYWFAAMFNDSTLDGNANGQFTFWINSATGASTQSVNLGAYTTFSNYGEYVKFDIKIDPVAQQFTSFTIQGTQNASPVNVLPTVQAALGGSSVFIPHLSVASSAIPNYVTVITGGNDSIVLDVDAISVTQTSAVPEPSSYAALAGLGALAFVSCRRRR